VSEQLCISQASDWYRVSSRQVVSLGGITSQRKEAGRVDFMQDADFIQPLEVSLVLSTSLISAKDTLFGMSKSFRFKEKSQNKDGKNSDVQLIILGSKFVLLKSFLNLKLKFLKIAMSMQRSLSKTPIRITGFFFVRQTEMDRLFKVVDLSMDVSLPPFYLRDPYEGVTVKLGQCLMKYIPKLGGVLMAWWDVRFKDGSAGIMWELPEVHTTVGLFSLFYYLFQ
jgi:hypothetical protein